MGEPLSIAFGQYELIERLAAGGMAELFKARVVGSHGFTKPIVIKRILPHLAADPHFVDMFIDEAKITARLSHPKIVQVMALGTENDQPFIAMEYVDGMDVLQLLRQSKATGEGVPVELAVHICHEVLDALDYAHQATSAAGAPLGIVHRDISPGNVMVSRRGDVKLADFGIARAVERQQHTATGTLKGKYGYMSPEQIVGADLDGRSDLFSVGIVLAELLMQRRLFTAPSDLDVLLMVRDVRLHRLERYGKDIPAGLRAHLHRALSRERDDRFASAGEFRDALADWLFSRGARVSARHLAELVERVRMVEPTRVDEAPREGVVAAEMKPVATLSGPSTRARQLQAEVAAQVGREKFAEAERVATPRIEPGVIVAEEDDDDAILIVEEPFEDDLSSRDLRAEEEAQAHPAAAVPPPSAARPTADPPTEEGSFRETSPLRLLCRLALERRKGLLRVERDAIIKETYFVSGHPQFVRSNVMRERLGEYLVARGVIGRDDLERALALLPHFGGRLGDTLVGLKLMKPLDAFHHLGGQVREKLVDACSWSEGRYRWYTEHVNPWPSLPLQLDTLEIMGAGAARIDRERIGAWAGAVAHRSPVANRFPRVPLEAFGLGSRPSYIFNLLDGRGTLRTLVGRFASPADRLDALRIIYLLVETDCARFS